MQSAVGQSGVSLLSTLHIFYKSATTFSSGGWVPEVPEETEHDQLQHHLEAVPTELL